MNTIKFKKGNTLMVAHRGLSGIAVISMGSRLHNNKHIGIIKSIYKKAVRSLTAFLLVKIIN